MCEFRSTALALMRTAVPATIWLCGWPVWPGSPVVLVCAAE